MELLWLFIAGLAMWAVVYLLHAIEFYEVSLSAFELKRRAADGDADAKVLTQREVLLPRIETIRRVAEAVSMVVAIALTIAYFGWLLGTLVAAILALMLGAAARLGFVADSADKLYMPHEQRLLRLVSTWNWLDALRGVIRVQPDIGAASKAELAYIIDQSAGVISKDELRRLQASLTLDAESVEDVMTPASVVDTIGVGDGLGPLVLDALHKTGHSRFPVIDGEIHHIVGILYLHDIINLKSAKAAVRDAMDKRVHYIHQNQSLEHALHGFLKTHHHLFVVVNDYRETVGVITLEDVIERLLGKKIMDEFDNFEDLRAVAESNPRKNNSPKGKTDV